MSQNGVKQQTDISELSLQRRAEEVQNVASGVWWFGSSAEGDIAEWWSPRRDVDLREFIYLPGNDILQGAHSSMVKKFKAMNWVIEGAERVANRYQPVLAEAEFGQGWGHLLSKVLADYQSQDKGAFIELIGQGDPTGPIEGPVLGIAHLDAGLCQLTGDPVYPVLFNNPKDGAPHKLHTTRVVHLVDMPSPSEMMYNIGFCATSRVIASSQVLLKLAQYKNEKLSDLPPAGIMAINNILYTQWEDMELRYERERRRNGQTLWTNVMKVFGLDPNRPISIDFTSFAQLPDQFDEQGATETYINIVALAFGVDVREFWPLSAGPLGTATETLVQHQKAKGKGVGDIISTLERAINWKILPPSVSFRFDFKDDEEDAQRAEIIRQKVGTIMEMWQPPNPQLFELGAKPPVSRDEIRQMLADNVPYFKEDFLEMDVTDEVEVSDTEVAKMLGPKVQIDRFGQVKRLKGQRAIKRVVDKALAHAMDNYRRGDVPADTLAEYLMAELIERG